MDKATAMMQFFCVERRTLQISLSVHMQIQKTMGDLSPLTA
jgi:hypothetical protein